MNALNEWEASRDAGIDDDKYGFGRAAAAAKAFDIGSSSVQRQRGTGDRSSAGGAVGGVGGNRSAARGSLAGKRNQLDDEEYRPRKRPQLKKKQPVVFDEEDDLLDDEDD